jgi:hypothetical protein
MKFCHTITTEHIVSENFIILLLPLIHIYESKALATFYHMENFLSQI